MPQRLTDLEIGYSHAPSIASKLTNVNLIGSEPTPATVVVVGIVLIAAYSVIWNLLLHRKW